MKKQIFCILFAISILVLSGCTQPEENGGNGMEVERVETGDKVSVEYRGTLQDGTQFDASEGRGPLEFTAGAGQMIKGFDKAVIGMALNQEKIATMPPSDAYGETDPTKIQEIPKSQITDWEQLEVGMSVTNSQGANGIVEEIMEETVLINFNHSLAGKTLSFWIKVVKIEKA